MHGRHQEDGEHKRHMWPAPSSRTADVTREAEPESLICFSEAGHRKVGVGDCALFQAGNAPPYIGIIRKLLAEQEGDLNLSVNWLYRPDDVALGKQALLEAAPNEIFYSFHRDEIPASSLLHPCKVAFLQKGVELPISSFVCRRAYDTANNCLYWLTDQDYCTDERQAEINELLEKTNREMRTAVSSHKSPEQPKVDGMNMTSHAGQGKAKKRERTENSLESNKRERSTKADDFDPSPLKRECNVKIEEIDDKDGGLKLTISSVGHLVELMHKQKDSMKKSSTSMSWRTSLANIIVAMDEEDLLSRFVQLGGIPVLDDWLQEVHKGKSGDSGSPKESDKGSEELLLALLQALEKLPVDLDVLKTCSVGKSVNHLRSHRNLEIQKKARKLVETWKGRVDAEMMKSSDDQKLGTNPSTSWSSKQPISEAQGSKGRSPTDRVNAKSNNSVKGHMPGGSHKEPAGGKLKTLGSDKVTGSTSLEKGPGEGVRTENFNTQRLIVRLPNPGRSPANSASGGSLADGGFLSTRASSPGFLERYDGIDVKSKASAIRPLEGGKAGNRNGSNVEKSGNGCNEEKEGSCLASGERSCVASADDADCKSSDAVERGCKEVKQSDAYDAAGAGAESKKLDSDNISSDGKRSLELNESSGCMLASLATCEGLEAEKSVSGVTMEELPPVDLHGSRDPNNSRSCFSNTELHNEGRQDGEKSEKDDLANMTGKGSPELGAAVDGGHIVAGPPHDLKGHGECIKEQPSCSVAEIGQEERSRDSAVEQHTLISRDSFSEQGLPTRVCSQDVPRMAASAEALIESCCRPLAVPAAIRESSRASLEELSVECDKVSDSNLTSLTDLVEHSCKEDALELARKVLNKDVESQGQEAAVSDNNSLGLCTAEPKHEDGVYDSAKSPKGAVNGSVTHSYERNCCTDAVVVDNRGSEEGETAADAISSVSVEGKGDRVSSHQRDAHYLGEDCLLACCSLADVKMKPLVMDEHCQASSFAILAAPTSTVTTLQPAEAYGLTEVALLAKGDDKDESKDVACRPVFDLNEGFISDDTLHDENGSQSKVCVSVSSLAVPDVLSGSCVQPQSSLAAPVAVVAATRGAFVPPSSPLRIKGELGWKGSAATSAFRRAEPRRLAEGNTVASDVVAAVVDSACHSVKRARILDIDLNVADEKVMEDTSTVSGLQPLPSGSALVKSSFISVRPKLDLNRVDESEDGTGLLSELRSVDPSVQASSFLAARPVVRDFDLNDGLDLDGLRMEEPPSPSPLPSYLHNGNIFKPESSGVADLVGAKFHSEIAWYSAAAAAANPVSSVVPAYTIGRSEMSYLQSSAPSVLSPGHHLSPYSTDMYQGGVVFSSSAISYSTTMPSTPVAPAISFTTNMPSASPVVSFSTSMPAGFSYAGYSFGSGFPFTSASYNMGTAPYVSSSNSSSIYPSTPSQLLNAGAIMSSYRRPYPPSVPDGSGLDSSVPWPRPSLDVNAGPNLLGDADAREEGLGSRNAPSQLAFQQSGPSTNGPVKRKESDSSFDPFRAGFKQMTWR